MDEKRQRSNHRCPLAGKGFTADCEFPGLGCGRGERGTEPPRREGVGYPPLSEMGAEQRREFHDAFLEADSFADLPGKWQAILQAERSRPKLRVVSGG